jgi:hypothetical protein
LLHTSQCEQRQQVQTSTSERTVPTRGVELDAHRQRWVQRREPSLVERVDHITHVVALTCINDVMSGTSCLWADINTTIARRNRTGSFAVRPIQVSFRPPSMDNGRTNTPRTTTRDHLPLDVRGPAWTVSPPGRLAGQRSEM